MEESQAHISLFLPLLGIYLLAPFHVAVAWRVSKDIK
jgi:hypothetical protein